jgi:hypothetical protein
MDPLEESLTAAEAPAPDCAFITANALHNATPPFLHRFAARTSHLLSSATAHGGSRVGRTQRPLLVFDDAQRMLETPQSMQMLRRLITMPRLSLLFVRQSWNYRAAASESGRA